MNKRAVLIFAIFAVMVSVAAMFLGRMRSGYTLGNPGVKVGDVPIYTDTGELVSKVSVTLPERGMTCASSELKVARLELGMLPPDTVYGRRLYRDTIGEFQMAMSVVLMGTDRTSIHKPQYCLQGQGWNIERSEVESIPISKPSPYDLKVMKLTLTRDFRGSDGKFQKIGGLFLYWFVADGQLTPHHTQRMWWMARDLVTTGRLQRWAYVACLAQCIPGQEDALLQQMKGLIAATVPQFQLTTGEQDRASLTPGGWQIASAAQDSLVPEAAR
jgi:hypothetical protein